MSWSKYFLDKQPLIRKEMQKETGDPYKHTDDTPSWLVVFFLLTLVLSFQIYLLVFLHVGRKNELAMDLKRSLLLYCNENARFLTISCPEIDFLVEKFLKNFVSLSKAM